MAIQGLVSSFLIAAAPPRIPLPSARNGSKRIGATKPVQCIITTSDQASGPRRNANYPPSFWDYNFVKSLASDYTVLKLAHLN